jgi:hypothetical protein
VRIAHTYVGGHYRVSTAKRQSERDVHGYETMVFDTRKGVFDEGQVVDEAHYHSIAESIRGHRAMVVKWAQHGSQRRRSRRRA